MQTVFDLMAAEGIGSDDVRALAAAFAAAYDADDLSAILRYHRRMTGRSLSPYLDGKHFVLSGLTRNFESAQMAAQYYLGGV